MSGNEKTPNTGFFWEERRFEPKRTFRWKVRFDNLVTHIPPQYVISAQKPNFGFTVESISDLGTPKYKKGPLELRPIEIVCIDDEQNTVSNWIHYYYKLAGLNFSRYSEIGNTTSRTLTDKTKNIEISMLNELGNVIEQYVLYNGWISDVKYSPLNYTEGGLATYTMIIVYDNYEYLVSPESAKTLTAGSGEANVKQILTGSAGAPINPLEGTYITKLSGIHGSITHGESLEDASSRQQSTFQGPVLPGTSPTRRPSSS